MALTVQKIISESGITFGTSGARGLVINFNDSVCAAFTQSFVSVMKQSFEFKRIAIGMDNRPSSLKMAEACAGMAKALGLGVDYYGVLPTPALACQVIADKIPGIMVTGSHIPFDRNGLKFYRPDGEISKTDEVNILSVSDSLKSFVAELPEVNLIAVHNYIKRYLDVFPVDTLKGKHIGIYEHSSAGRDIYALVFKYLGARVTSLGRTETFVPIDTEAVSEGDTVKALNWAAQYNFDAIFSTDGDGDRPLISDEQGQWLRGDILGLLCARTLKIEHLAVPVSCNTAIELSGDFKTVTRTRIGSPYVICEFSRLENTSESYAGFEANGGFLLGSKVTIGKSDLCSLPTRDALLPALSLFLAAREMPISELVKQLPERHTVSDRIQDISISNAEILLSQVTNATTDFLIKLGLSAKKIESIDSTDGKRLIFTDGDIVHLRLSGNAPELRCYCESFNIIVVKELCFKVVTSLKLLFESGDFQ